MRKNEKVDQTQCAGSIKREPCCQKTCNAICQIAEHGGGVVRPSPNRVIKIHPESLVCRPFLEEVILYSVSQTARNVAKSN